MRSRPVSAALSRKVVAHFLFLLCCLTAPTLAQDGDVIALQALSGCLGGLSPAWYNITASPCEPEACDRAPCPSSLDGVSCLNGRVYGIDLNLGPGSTGPEQEGCLPAALANATELQELHLRGRRLVGPIPPSLSTLSLLRTLDLSMNMLSGGIPTELGSLAMLRQLVLQQNKLTGTLPSSLAACGSLEMLMLYNNVLTGSLPGAWGGLTRLTLLDLSGNSLSGLLPPEWFRMLGLSMLSLQNNALVGPIPSSWEGMYNLTLLNLSGNCGICGPPLTPANSHFTLVYTGTGINQACEDVDCTPNTFANHWIPLVLAGSLGFILLIVVPLSAFVVIKVARGANYTPPFLRSWGATTPPDKLVKPIPFQVADLVSVDQPDGARESAFYLVAAQPGDGSLPARLGGEAENWPDNDVAEDDAEQGPLDPRVFPLYHPRPSTHAVYGV